MKIYTRRGDRGETSLFGGQKVVKDSLRIEAYGSVDELNSVLGVARSLSPSKEIDAILKQAQNNLFVLGADLATPPGKNSQKIKRVNPSDVDAVEAAIDKLEEKLPKLASFILPGGTPLAAQIQVARAVCRRAERDVVRLLAKEKTGETPIVFLNRLSDLLFVLARYANKVGGGEETKWKQS